MQIIRKNVFKGCKSLSSISLPASAISVDDGAFQGCTSLTGVSLGKNVKHIGTSAFTDDAKLISVDRFNNAGLTGDTFDIVGNCAFKNTGLTAANLALRSSAIQTFWGDECFAGCKALKDANFTSANYMARDMFKGCTSLTGVTFKNDQMAYTYPRIFNGCTSLKTVTLPKKLLFMPDEEFKDCTALTSVRFTGYDAESTIDELQYSVFSGCKSLTSIEMPASIDNTAKIDPECLNGMQNLKRIKFHGLSGSQIANDVSQLQFPSLPNDFTMNQLYVLPAEPWYGLFNEYDIAQKRVQGHSTNECKLDITQEQFSAATAVCDANYKTLTSLIQYATTQNVPVYIIIGLKHTEMEIEPVYFKSDFATLAYEAASDLPFPIGANMSAVNSPNIHTTTKANKALSCSALWNKRLLDIYSNPAKYAYSSEYIRVNGTRYKESNIAKQYMTKYQLSGFFIGYTLDIGENHYSKNAEISNDIKIRLLELSAIPLKKSGSSTVNGVIRNSGFKAINNFFISKETQVHNSLRSLTNYSMYIATFNGSRYNKKSIYMPNYSIITGEDAFNKLSAQQWNDLTANTTFLTSDILPVSYQVQCLKALNRLIFINSSFKSRIVKLDEDFGTADGNKLSSYKISQKPYTDAILTSGFFGLKHDVEFCGCDSNSYSKYMYDAEEYVAPDYTQFSVNKTATSNFNTNIWYYNAKELYDFCKANHKPCLFIYSLFGCGPCGIFQNRIWKNADFQDWFAQQNFYHCMLECEQQPMYDKQLQFCTDVLSPNAINFAKEDVGEKFDAKPVNVFGGKYRRWKAGNSTAQSLMTPVLVFMDSTGKCYDFTYHNIATNIAQFGVDGMIQQLKSLCLYHFDGNSLQNAKYVVDAGKELNVADYIGNYDNPFAIADNAIDLSKSTVYDDITYSGQDTVANLVTTMKKQLQNANENSNVNIVAAAPVYLGGCMFDDIPWIPPTFGDNVDEGPDPFEKLSVEFSAAELADAKLSAARGLFVELSSNCAKLNAKFADTYIKIGNEFYIMQFDLSSSRYGYKYNIMTNCGRANAFPVRFDSVSNPELKYTIQ